MRQYSDAEFCACMVDTLKLLGLADSDLEAAGADFLALTGMGSKYKDLRTTLRSCLE